MAAHRYWRIYITALQGGNVATGVREIQFRETSGGANVATGGTAIASSGTGVASAFDGNTATSFSIGTSVPTWIGYDFGGSPRDITEFVWTTEAAANSPTAMMLEWSDDLTTWRPLFPVPSVTPAWSANETKTFTQPVITNSVTVPSSAGNLLFVGAELEDFVASSQNSSAIGFNNNSAGTFYRSGYGRGYVYMTGPHGTYSIWANFAPSTTFGVTYRSYWSTTNSSFTVAGSMMTLGSGANNRLRLRRTTTTDPSTLTLDKFDGTTATTLGVSTATVAGGTLQRFDILVDNYGASGRVRVYVNQVLFIDTGTMDIAAGGTTALDRLTLYPNSNTTSFTSLHSEVIVAAEDTRPLSVVTLAPNGGGDVNTNDSGGWADIDDLTASEIDAAVMSNAGQALSVSLSGAPSGASGFAVRGVKVVAGAARGSTGPTKLAMGVRSQAVNAFNTAQTLETGWGVVSATWANNPATSAAFSISDLENLQLVYRADT